MDRNIRYEVLINEDEAAEEASVRDAPSLVTDPAPEQQTETTEEPVTLIESNPEDQGASVKIPEPPSYNIATSLPSYEEAEQTKQSEEEVRQQTEQEEQSQATMNSAQRVGDIYLGTDSIFICSFLLAFLFNAVGLFAILCVSQTIAARFGAVSGFGLSIVKYAALMKYPNLNWGEDWDTSYSWLWWFMLFLGLLMFFRGCFQYIRIKHQWNKLSQQTRGKIYLYF